MNGQTLLDKIWATHCVTDPELTELGGGRSVILIDRVLLHEITGGFALRDLEEAGQVPRMAAADIFAVADHAISTAIDRGAFDSPSTNGSALIQSLARNCNAMGIRYAEPNSHEHGIVHVIAPEQGLVAPGMTLICGDSHTCTLGAFGSLSFAVGASDIATALKHNALIIHKPKSLRMELTGKLQPHVSAKDAMLSLISHYGNEAANGYAIEFTGEIVANLDIEARLTLCNMAAELGTRYALIAPDMPLLAYIAKQRDVALPDLPSEWAELYSDTDAAFDLEYNHDLSAVEPQVTWGTSPMQAVSVSGRVPALPNAARALTYMQLQPGTAIESIAIDAAFIGSCTNARLSDLRIAAQILKGRKIAKRIKAMCTPGSFAVRKAAEAEGIDQIFKEAGFEWRMPGCSNCAGREGAIWANQRVISSTNRNFENRQGPGTRTHLASPATVAASAIAGHIADPRKV